MAVKGARGTPGTLEWLAGTVQSRNRRKVVTSWELSEDKKVSQSQVGSF